MKMTKRILALALTLVMATVPVVRDLLVRTIYPVKRFQLLILNQMHTITADF